MWGHPWTMDRGLRVLGGGTHTCVFALLHKIKNYRRKVQSAALWLAL